MKGTARRGRTGRDAAAVEMLRRSRKERAENVMIVDMVRNDLGRIARVGSVEVLRLFEAGSTDSLADDLGGRLRQHRQPRRDHGGDVPPASITGAPKARTMEIIARSRIGRVGSTPAPSATSPRTATRRSTWRSGRRSSTPGSR
jgi:anthranilate/para-aminobenzoate synthase component I